MPGVHRLRQVPVAFTAAARVAVDAPLDILTGSPGGETTLVLEVGKVRVEREVRVTVREVVSLQRPFPVAVVGFRVEAAEHSGWFPVLDAELELTPLGHEVEVALEGEYRVPGTVAGAVADRAALHRVADRVLDRYFSEITDRLGSLGERYAALTGVPEG